jgi:hypothetical protein
MRRRIAVGRWALAGDENDNGSLSSREQYQADRILPPLTALTSHRNPIETVGKNTNVLSRLEYRSSFFIRLYGILTQRAHDP